MENRILKTAEIISFFTIDDFKKEYFKEYKKDIVVYYPIALNETNWYEYKEKFKKERFNNSCYKNLTDKEIIDKEIKKLDNMLNNLGLIYFIKHRDTFETLAKRYKDYLILSLQSNNEKNNNLTKSSIMSKQNILIPDVNIDEVFNHFETLTKSTNRNDKFYLTNKQLLIFINATFIECKPIKQKFKGSFSKDKIDVRSVFRKFQDNCSLRENNNKHLKQKYFNILNKSFAGFNQTDSDKWHKTNNKIPTPEKLKSK